MADFVLKKSNTVPILTATLSDSNGVVNLTAASSVRIKVARAETPTVSILNALCAIVSPTLGKISYTWQAADTAIAGDYVFEFAVAWADGSNDTFPNDRMLTLRINPIVI